MQRQPGVWAQMMFAFTLAPCVEFPLLEQSLGAALQLEEQGGGEEPALVVELVEDAILRGAYGKAEQEEPGEESLPGKEAAYWLLGLVAGGCILTKWPPDSRKPAVPDPKALSQKHSQRT